MMSRRCLAIASDGSPVSVFSSLKDAAYSYNVQPSRIWNAITTRQILLELMWMYEEDYFKVLENGKESSLAWGKNQKKPKRKRGKMSDAIREKIALTKSRNSAYCRNAIFKFYKEFSTFHVDWMKRLKNAFLSINDFGIRPELLADYYTDIRDKEIALLASLIVPFGDKCLPTVMSLRSTMGETPWEWFKNRGFYNATGLNRMMSANLFTLLDSWWEECFKFGSYDSIEKCVASKSELYGISLLNVIEKISKGKMKTISHMRMALFLLICSHSDGLGQGLWNIPRERVILPITGGLKGFLQTWLPDFTRVGSPDECVSLFDMDTIDFYYCHLAYERLKICRPKECSQYASFFHNAYTHRVKYNQKKWESMFPTIDFTRNEDWIG